MIAVLLAASVLAQNNVLSAVESASGWKLLFNGTSNAGWVRPDGSAGRFTPQDSALKAANGDICTQAEYDDFELTIDYRYDAGGNSGIFLRTKKGMDPPWLNGMEVAIQDNGRKNNLYKNGDAAVYDVFAPTKDMWTGPGKWNRVVIWLSGTKLEHWHNGEKVIDEDMASARWKTAVAQSKFSDKMFTDNNWGKETKGQVCLQDHGPEHGIWFRNMKLRPIVAGSPLPAPLFTPKGGAYAGPVDVSLAAAVVGAVVRYTLDGSAPTATSPAYSGPIRIASPQTLKAALFRAGSTPSAVLSETYQVGPAFILALSRGNFRTLSRDRKFPDALGRLFPRTGASPPSVPIFPD